MLCRIPGGHQKDCWRHEIWPKWRICKMKCQVLFFQRAMFILLFNRPLYWLIWNTVFPDMLISDSPPHGRHRTPWYPEMTRNFRRPSTSAGYLKSTSTAPPAGQLKELSENENESLLLTIMTARSVSSLNDPAHAVKKKERLPPALTLRHVLYVHMVHGCVWKNNYMRNMNSRRR